MGDVLQRAAVLCLCKLTCSFSVLPSLGTSYSPVSWCCCCLLIFTDFLVTVFLGVLSVVGSRLTELTALGDAIALRFLLFLSHLYGAVLLLITPLMAVETLSRLLSDAATRRTASPAAASGGKVTVERHKESSCSDEGERLTHVVAYFCCLSVWVMESLNVMWRWKLEEVWSAACLHTTNSLIRCLPSLFHPVPVAVNPLWGTAFLSLLLLLLITNTGLHRRHRAPAQTEATRASKRGVRSNCGSSRQGLVPVESAPCEPGMSASHPTQSVDPAKTESSCAVHRAYFWNSVQMSARYHGDFVLISSACLSAERGRQEHGRTKTGTTLTFITVEHEDPQHTSQHRWGFPCPGANVMVGLVGVLSVFVLPLNLSVNILLIRTIETLLELCLQSIVSSASSTLEIPAPHYETLV